jgi:hypothetical protein
MLVKVFKLELCPEAGIKFYILAAPTEQVRSVIQCGSANQSVQDDIGNRINNLS